jgi:hypothetical protein
VFEPRVYTVIFGASAQTNAVDWFELTAPSTMGIMLLGLDISQTTELGDAAEEMIDWYVKRATSTYTSGSGGNTSVTRSPINPGDAAASFTAETLNTTKIAVGTGALATVHNSAFNVRAGLDKLWTPETAIRCPASGALAIGMTANPADSITWVGTAYVGELS